MLGIVKRTGHMNIEAFTGDDILSGICFIVQHLQGGGRRGGTGSRRNMDAQQLLRCLFSLLCVHIQSTFYEIKFKNTP